MVSNHHHSADDPPPAPPACCSGLPIERIRLTRCPHGTFHLFLGGQTLHLQPRELLMIARGINRWVFDHPQLLSEIDADAWERIDKNIELD